MVNEIIEQFDRFGILPHTLPNAIGMWPNEQECLVWCAAQCDPDINWLEIGSFCGGSAVLLALVKAQYNTQSKVVCVDNNFNPMFNYNVYKNGKFIDTVIQLECDSINILDYYHDPLSFVFLDGWHSFRNIIKEFELLSNLMTQNAIICFHDVSPQMTLHNQEYINQRYEYVKLNWQQLINNHTQDFLLDEAVSFICKDFGYKIIDIPVRTNETHFEETRLKQWVRGTTSPYNSFTAIKKE
jgi:predicted O-methyltransferase YrrM